MSKRMMSGIAAVALSSGFVVDVPVEEDRGGVELSVYEYEIGALNAPRYYEVEEEVEETKTVTEPVVEEVYEEETPELSYVPEPEPEPEPVYEEEVIPEPVYEEEVVEEVEEIAEVGEVIEVEVTSVVEPVVEESEPVEEEVVEEEPETVPVAVATSSVPVAVWDQVAECESGGDWGIDTGNSYYGGLQQTKIGWDTLGGNEFAPYPNQATKDEQIIIAERLLAIQGWGAWPICGQNH